MRNKHNNGLDAYGFAILRAASRADRMAPPVSYDGRGFDSLQNVRRGFAAPSLDGFSNGESRKRGGNTPIPLRAKPCGRLSSLPRPYARSVNPHGAAHPLTGVCGGFSANVRNPAMSAHTHGRISTASHSLSVTQSLAARDVEALFLRRTATSAQTARVAHALEEITLQTLAALNAAAVGRTDVLVNVKPEDGADIEAVLVGLRYALALLTPADDYGEEEKSDGLADGDCDEEEWPDYFENEEDEEEGE